MTAIEMTQQGLTWYQFLGKSHPKWDRAIKEFGNVEQAFNHIHVPKGHVS